MNLYELRVFILHAAGFDPSTIITKIHLPIISMWFRTQSSLGPLGGFKDVRVTISHDGDGYFGPVWCVKRMINNRDVWIFLVYGFISKLWLSMILPGILSVFPRYFPWDVLNVFFVPWFSDHLPVQDGAELQQSYDCSAGRATFVQGLMFEEYKPNISKQYPT